MRVLLVVAMAVLVACGSSSERPTVLGLWERLDRAGVRCSGLEVETGQRELGSREEGSCDLDQETLTILVYNSNDARDLANGMAAQFGAISVIGDRWAVRVGSDATAERVRKALGGRVS